MLYRYEENLGIQRLELHEDQFEHPELPTNERTDLELFLRRDIRLNLN
jgi:hypothetical protein